MTELFDDTELRTAFREFADGSGPYVRPPGAEQAWRGARLRIRNRRVLVAGAAAVAVLVPAAVVALARDGGPNSLPPPPATNPVVTTVPTTSTTSTASPSPTVTPTPTTTEGQYGVPTTGPGQLVNTTLTLSWPDPSAEGTCGGGVTVTDGYSGLIVLSTMPFDIDGDGTNEVVANIFCQLGQVGPSQLVAIRLDGGAATVLGTVVATAATDGSGALQEPDGPGVAAIWSYAGWEDMTVLVDVTNKITCCGTPRESAVVQQRTYRWSDSSFTQVGGPTTFVADPSFADVEVTVPTLAFSAPENDVRSATLSVGIRNHGPQTASDVTVYLDYGWAIEEPSGGDWARCEADPAFDGGRRRYAVCAVGDLPPGQTVTLTLPMQRDSRYEAEEIPHFSTYTGLAEVRAGTSYYPAVRFSLTAA